LRETGRKQESGSHEYLPHEFLLFSRGRRELESRTVNIKLASPVKAKDNTYINMYLRRAKFRTDWPRRDNASWHFAVSLMRERSNAGNRLMSDACLFPRRKPEAGQGF